MCGAGNGRECAGAGCACGCASDEGERCGARIVRDGDAQGEPFDGGDQGEGGCGDEERAGGVWDGDERGWFYCEQGERSEGAGSFGGVGGGRAGADVAGEGGGRG